MRLPPSCFNTTLLSRAKADLRRLLLFSPSLPLKAMRLGWNLIEKAGNR